ncbi:alpha/beta hydrolase [Thioalkalivibrio sp. ALgr3]|uniref:alpha/beta hydrolase n=1 Tax=Thioalkalivibrio sp. ALgr3 TaxID=1239292 RepID=UPI00035E5A0B|nr:alpha/beta hydrolase [Thioalkalivibrio sp. ALgr3]
MLRIAAVLLLGLGIFAGWIAAQSWEAMRVLQDIEAGAGPSALKERTPEPARETLSLTTDEGDIAADLYHPRQEVGARIVLVPGFTPQGKDDPRLVQLAHTLARARFLVLVPDLQGSRALSVRREDAATIGDAAALLARLEVERAPDEQDVGVAAISYGVGLAVLATLKPEGKETIDFLVGIGGYYDTGNVVTFATTGAYREPGSNRWQTRTPDPLAKWLFLWGNLHVLDDRADRALLDEIARRRAADPEVPIDDLSDPLGEEGRSLLALILNDDHERVPQLLDDLPAGAREAIESWSLAEHDLSHLSGRALLIHGRDDTMIPHTESTRLARAIGDTDLHRIDGFSHIDPHGVGLIGQWRLLRAMTDLLAWRDDGAVHSENRTPRTEDLP